MLRVINAMGSLPVNYEVDAKSKFIPGQVGQLKVTNSGRIVCGKSNGKEPLGLIDDIRTSEYDTTNVSKRITVWMCNGVFETDQFDTSKKYSTGTSLFVDKNGSLTANKVFKTSSEIGICCSSPTEESPTLKFVWLGLK